MQDILDHTNAALDLLEQAHERMEKKLEWNHGLRIGDYVLVRYAPEKCGRIEDVLIKHPNPKGNCPPFGMFLVRLIDGTFIEEHPEYLAKAKPPELKVVS